ncbi:MAG: lipoprotein insertase outer membrane protein LolB [Candidatus Methylomirabilales bacterium]
MGLAVLVLVTGCATFPPPREAGHPVSRHQREEFLTQLHVREGQIRSLRGIAVVEITLNQDTRRLREAVALRTDGRFRLETLGALGLPVMIIASDGDRVTVRRAAGQKGVPEDGRELLAQLLGLQLPPASLVRLLVGLPPRPVAPSASVFYLPQRQAYLLEEERSGSVERLYLDPSGNLLGGEIWEDGEGLRFRFSAVREVKGIPFPIEITLTQVRRPVSLTVTYQAVEINPFLSDHLFSLPIPAAAENRGR